MSEIAVFIGGIIPNEDVPRLKDMGILEVFGPGTPTTDIIRVIRETVLGENVL
jgi:methylmalonyl-CoA mutase C-terminal domain/subunit